MVASAFVKVDKALGQDGDALRDRQVVQRRITGHWRSTSRKDNSSPRNSICVFVGTYGPRLAFAALDSLLAKSSGIRKVIITVAMKIILWGLRSHVKQRTYVATEDCMNPTLEVLAENARNAPSEAEARSALSRPGLTVLERTMLDALKNAYFILDEKEWPQTSKELHDIIKLAESRK